MTVGGDEFSSLMARLQVLMQRQTEATHTDILPQTVRWAIAILVRDGYSQEWLMFLLANRSLKGQWWVLRQFLSAKALQQLEQHLLQQWDGSK